MSIETITYTISAEGKVSIDVSGVSGGKCKELTKAIEEKLGEVDNVEFKSEYYQQSTENEANTVTGGNIYKSRW